MDDNKSILANTDWKKLWLESGQLSSSGRIDNHLDSSDSTLVDDGEVMAHNTTVQLGGVAFLVCKVAGVDRMYTNDERFAILHTPGSNTWTLQIKFVQRRDHGTYECQNVSIEKVRASKTQPALLSVCHQTPRSSTGSETWV
uniref:Immunoglobulin V-set domain-containing protein n=1 Tax=Anopheles farauti TaxID=69004 RepID=A0A182QVU8_9DIPT